MNKLILAVLVLVSACTHAGSVVLQTGQCVLDSGVELTVIADLAQANYAQLIADLETKVGPTLVTCVLQAIAAEQGSGSGSGSGSAAPTPDIHARARELLAKGAK